MANHSDDRGIPSLDNWFKVLGGIQDQIRFADAKGAFVFGINTLMFGFVAGTVATLKKTLASSPAPAVAWVTVASLILFAICAVVAVGFLICAVMSRFGALAPKSRVFFGHIASQFGKDYGKYVSETRKMSVDDWLNEVGTQIVETSHIARAKHLAVKIAAIISLIGLVFWVVAVFSSAFLP